MGAVVAGPWAAHPRARAPLPAGQLRAAAQVAPTLLCMEGRADGSLRASLHHCWPPLVAATYACQLRDELRAAFPGRRIELRTA